jgi:large subunit ribosomal protein L22
MSKVWQRPNRRDALLGDREGAYAIARHIRMSPQKVRRVVDVVRGMDVNAALDVLRFAPQAASEPIYKVVASAVANAENLENLKASDLYLSQIFVDEGVTMRRIRPRAKGSASRILKRASHITAVVEPSYNRGPIPVSKQVVTKRLAQVEAEEKAKADAKKAAAKKTEVKAEPKAVAKTTEAKAEPKAAAKTTEAKAAPKTTAAKAEPKTTAAKAEPKAAAKTTPAKSEKKEA